MDYNIIITHHESPEHKNFDECDTLFPRSNGLCDLQNSIKLYHMIPNAKTDRCEGTRCGLGDNSSLYRDRSCEDVTLPVITIV